MSTSAKSAQEWLMSKKPSINEIQSMLEKLEHRIENWSGNEDAIQGSIDAALLLQAHLDQNHSSSSDEAQPSVYFTTDSLIPDQKPIMLEEAIKRETFAALKSRLGKVLK